MNENVFKNDIFWKKKKYNNNNFYCMALSDVKENKPDVHQFNLKHVL